MQTLRYVILHHTEIPEPHFDLMFEREPAGPLVTWRSSSWPLQDNSLLEPLGEHRRSYLDYEGEIGGGRGSVRRVAGGTFQWMTRGEHLTSFQIATPLPETWLVTTVANGSTIATRA